MNETSAPSPAPAEPEVLVRTEGRARIITLNRPRALNALNRGARDYPDIPASHRFDAATEKALDGFMRTRPRGGETVLLKAIEVLQGERYLRLAEKRPANEAFLYGWLANRLG